MLLNYLKITFRNIKRHKGFYLINILGLAIGIACSILIVLFVSYELSYDKYHKNNDRIYRLAVDAIAGNTMIYQTYTPAPLPAALYKEFPEIEKITRISTSSEVKTRYKDLVFSEDRVFAVDSTFFEIFSYEIINGNKSSALLEPYSVVLTQSMAKKYFGNENPINEVLHMDTIKLKVTGIVADVPEQSHFHFDFLVSLTSYDGLYNGSSWWWNNFRTYILLNQNTEQSGFEVKLPDFVSKYLFEGKDYDEIISTGNKWEYYLQPLTDIHLNSDIAGEFESNGNKTYVYIFGVIAVFILIMACINFMNLSTAKSTRRAREVGIRKVSGATKPKLITQFITESIFIAIISLAIGILIVEILLPFFSEFTNRNLSLRYFDNILTIPILILLSVIIGAFSGIYPAFVLSSYIPIKVLKGRLSSANKGFSLRNVLVIFQFTISIFLIIGTFVVLGQLQMIQNKNLGFDKENIIVIRNAYLLGDKSEAFKGELLQNPNIIKVAGSHKMPGMRLNNIGFGAEGLDDGFTLNLLCCDPEYAEVMNFEMVHGRFFSEEYSTDTTAIVINEAAMNLIGWEDPIGKKVNNWGENRVTFPVIGVVKDFHYESMHEKVRPQAFMYLGGSYSWNERFIAVKIKQDSETETLEFLEKKWQDFSVELPFSFTFFAQDYNHLYQNEKQTKDLMLIFSILAIFIACLGLLGLASFMASQKTKEIGIRKTYGASSENIIWSFSKEFIKWILIANIIAWPIAYFAMDRWLQNFEYRIAINWWIFVVAAIIGLFIALVSVSFQSIKASLANPIDALRYE